MARMLSHVHSIIRGSVGGLTYTANQWHAIIARARTGPVNPNTTRQSLIRSAFSAAQQEWLTLTDAGRDAWDAYADTCQYSGALGNYTIPGRLMFTACIGTAKFLNSLFPLIIPAIDYTAPVIPGFLNLDTVITGPPSLVGTGFSVGATQNGTEDVAFYAERSIPFNPTRYRYKGPWLTPTLDSVSIAAPGSGIIDFLDLTEDMAYFCKCRGIVAVGAHRISNDFFLRAIAEVNAGP